jgi:hypothetical protein
MFLFFLYTVSKKNVLRNGCGNQTESGGYTPTPPPLKGAYIADTRNQKVLGPPPLNHSVNSRS